RAVVIGASTGGPAVLAQLLPQIAQHSPVPVCVVTHLLAGFSEFLAESLARRCPEAQVAEAGEGVSAGPRQVFLAPSGRHLRLRTVGDRLCTALDDSPPELGFRPAVDVLFRSAAQTLRDRVLAVVLTGMDRDGTQGALAIRAAGGHVVVQDEASSVVWGMPGSVVAAGAAHEIVPLAQLGRTLRRHLGIPSPAAPPAGAR
ncbi:MAG: CheB methylesterase domain-containing protein, partial [Planctomycetaceae bacterium]